MELKYCPNCMGELDGSTCQKCGFDTSAGSKEGTLAWNTRLNGKYISGVVLNRDEVVITYLGMEPEQGPRVLIREFFPQGAAFREDGEVKWRNAKAEGFGCTAFLKDAQRLMKRGNVPGLVHYLDSFQENGTAYIVTSCPGNKRINAFIQENGRVTPERCILLLQPLFDCLSELHALGFIHGAVSPENMVIDSNGVVTLLGLAPPEECEVFADIGSRDADDGFTAPEVLDGGARGEKSDIYSLCASIFYCLTGKVPAKAQRRKQDPSLAWGSVNVPMPIRDALERGLSISIQDRVKTIEELLKRLEGDYTIPLNDAEFNEGISYGTTDDPFKEMKKSKVKKEKTKIIKMVAAVAIVVVALLIGMGISRTLQENKLGDKDSALSSISTENDNDADNSKDEDGADNTDDKDSENQNEDEEDAEEDDEKDKEQSTPQKKDKISMNLSECELEKGASINLQVAGIDNDDLTWKSSGKKTVSVDDEGVATALAVGTATITAETSDGRTASCSVTVPGVVEVVIDEPELLLEVGQSHTFTVTVTKFGNVDDKIMVSSTDISIASMHGMTLTALQPGETQLVFTAAGTSATCNVMVTAGEGDAGERPPEERTGS